MAQEEMCPICTTPFADEEIVMQYRARGTSQTKWAHVRCVMVLSTPDKKPSR
jgi:hypothetical protein